jgi:hypothetical protein
MLSFIVVVEIKLDYHNLHAQYHCTIPLTPGNKELNTIRFVNHWNEIQLSSKDTPERLGSERSTLYL